MEEVRALGESVLEPEGQQAPPADSKQAWKRFEEIKSLRDALFSQVDQLQKTGGEGVGQDGAASPARGLKIPADIRKAKVAQIMGLLERESALVDAVKTRLERLSVG